LSLATKIEKEIIKYYEKLYAKTEDWRPKLEMRECHVIDENDNNKSMTPFEA